jgi:hypothetical protein
LLILRSDPATYQRVRHQPESGEGLTKLSCICTIVWQKSQPPNSPICRAARPRVLTRLRQALGPR